MRYALISDIHANWQAWQAVLDDIQKAGVDGVICLGDIVGYGPQPAQVLESVYDASDLFILGNHDAVICGRFDSECFNDEAKIIIDWTAQQLNESAEDFFNQVPMMVIADEFACSHAEFAIPERFDYIYDPPEAIESFEAVEQPLLFVGHTHYPGTIRKDTDGKMSYFKPQDFTLQQEARYLVNVGSVGDPRNGDIRASYCIYDLDKNTVEFRNVPFDIEEFRRQIAQAGIPTKPILFDYADHLIDADSEAESPKRRDFHVNEEITKAAAGPVTVERISDGNLHTRQKIKIGAGAVGDGAAFRSAQAARVRAARKAAQRRKKNIVMTLVVCLLLLVSGVSAYLILNQPPQPELVSEPPTKADPPIDATTTVEADKQGARAASSTPQVVEADPGPQPITEAIELIGAQTKVFAFVPSAENGGDTLDDAWKQPGNESAFSAWTPGTNGVGYEDAPAGYKDLIKLSLRDEMEDKSTSCYIRIPFTLPPEIEQLDQIPRLELHIQVDDGYRAFLNGVNVAEFQVPPELTWDATATKGHEDKIAMNPLEVDLSSVISELRIGSTNVLAIHGLNVNLGSSDFLIRPLLTARPAPATAHVAASKTPESAADAAGLNQGAQRKAVEAELRKATDVEKREKRLAAAANIYANYKGPFAEETKDWRNKEAKALRDQLRNTSNDLKKELTSLLLEEKYEEAFAAYDRQLTKTPDLKSSGDFKQFSDEIIELRKVHQKILATLEQDKNNPVSVQTRIGRLHASKDTGTGAQVLYAIMLAHTGQKGSSEKSILLFEKSKTTLGTSLKIELEKIQNTRREAWGGQEIARLKKFMGITKEDKEPEVMRRAVYQRILNTHPPKPPKIIIHDFQSAADKIKAQLEGTKTYTDNQALFELVEQLSPLMRVTTHQQIMPRYYRLLENDLSGDKKKLSGVKKEYPSLEIKGSKKFRNTEFGRLLHFDGQQTHVIHKEASPIKQKGTSFTLTFWTRPQHTNRNSYYITLGRRDAPFENLRLGYNKEGKRMMSFHGNNPHLSPDNLKFDRWQFNVITYQNSTLQWYIPRAKTFTYKTELPLNLQSLQLLIGAGIDQKNTPNDKYKGFLTELQIYNRALIPNEINRMLAPLN